jgi:small subunit ribosomal protein S8
MVDVMDRFTDAINQIKTDERIGREGCILDSTKLVKKVLEVMKRENYIKDYEEFTEGKFKKLRVKLANKINKIGVVKPRFAVSYKIIQKYEMRYIPSRDFGILLISTPKGVMTNREIKEARIGGRLIAYVY